MTTKPIIVAGGGGHAKVVIGILKKLSTYRVLGYTDHQNNGEILGVPYLGDDRAFDSFSRRGEALSAVIGVGQVGTGQKRHELWAGLRSRSLDFPLIVSPGAIVNDGASAGEATVVMDGAVVNAGANLGRGVIVNTNSTVEHDVTIGDWVHIAPGATISGGVKIGLYSMAGAGATIIEGIRIAENCIIGAGATVIDDLTEPGVYVGCPARRIK